MNKFDRSKSKIIKKFGKNITVTYRNSQGDSKYVDFSWPNLVRSPMNFSGYTRDDPFEPLNYKISTKNLMSANCTNCNSTKNIEMHHIKHIKSINTKLSDFDKMVAAINRKQVPLCRECHVKIHMGEYKGVNLKKNKN